MNTRHFERHYLIMLIPGMLWLILFSLVPMLGNVIAFQDYNPVRGFFRSDWIGWGNFEYMFSLRDFRVVLFNTVFLSVLKIIAHLTIPLTFALLLNEVRNLKLKRTVQTVVYLPHFLSWVILGGIVKDVLLFSGPVNLLIELFGGEPVLFLARAQLFPAIVVTTDVWKEFGFNAIIYIAGLTAIDPALYESAAMDGTSKWQELRFITLPGIKTTIILLATLSLGRVLNAGFEQIFNLYNPLVYSTGDILDTWIYRVGLINFDFGLATAVGMFKSLVGFVLIFFSYFLADKFANYRIF